MHLSNNQPNNLHQQNFGGGVSYLSYLQQKKKQFYEALTGEENPGVMAVLLFVLTFLFHCCLAIIILKPAEVIIPAVPLMMEVAMVAQVGKQAAMAPPTPVPVKPVEPPKPKVNPVKKPVKKKTEVHKQQPMPKPSAQEESASSSVSQINAVATASVTKSSHGTEGSEVPFTEASSTANYGSNPKPIYPTIATRRGWEGQVSLKVEVTVEGLSQSVTVYKSSGHEELDEAAVTAVEKWQFTPAKRGNEDVASTVIVPIIFSLNH